MGRLLSFVFLSIISLCRPAGAQSWFTDFSEPNLQAQASKIVQTPDGGYVITGAWYEGGNVVVSKLDPDGKKQWSKILKHTVGDQEWKIMNSSVIPVIVEADSSFVIGASPSINGETSEQLLLWHLDQDGNVLDSTLSSTMSLQGLTLTADHHFLAVAHTYVCAGLCDQKRSLFLLDSTHQLIREYKEEQNLSDVNLALDAVELSNGRFMMLGSSAYFEGNDWYSTTYLEYYGRQGGFSSWQLKQDVAGTIPTQGQIDIIDDQHAYVGFYHNNYYRVRKLNVIERKTKWERPYDVKWKTQGRFAETQDEGVVMAALSNDTTLLLVKYDSLGHLIWRNSIHVNAPPRPTPPHYRIATLSDVILARDGGFVLIGSYVNDWTSGLYKMFVLRTNAFGKVGGRVEGFVRAEIEQDCDAHPSEPGLGGWIIEARGDTTSFYATTDSSGHYHMWIPPGRYSMHFSHASMSGAAACQDGDTITVVNQTDTIHFSAAISGIEDCSLLSVDVSIPFVRNCTTNVYKIQYCNFGPDDIAIMNLEVRLSEHMEFVSSSAPYQLQDSVFQFALMDVQSGECGSILYTVHLNCQTPMDSPHCLEAVIRVDSLCLPPGSPSHNPYHDKDCQVSGMPFDPNEKLAQPAGDGPERKIPLDTRLTYTIHFQNLGSDTAFNVVIRDTLSSQYDIRSFDPGGSSHPYRWQIKDQRVLEIEFDQIELPDSTTHEPASKGYVSFSLLPDLTLLPGSRIENEAYIYFDYVAPVRTGTVSHTLDKYRVWIEREVTICAGDPIHGQPVYTDTTLTDTLTTIYSDTIVSTQVTVRPVQDLLVMDWFCKGDINPVSGYIFDSIGMYTEVTSHINQWGCDSIVHYTFTVSPSFDDTIRLELPVGMTYKEILIEKDTVLTWFDTTEYGCHITLTEIINAIVTDIMNPSQESSIHIYPNPFQHDVWIDIPILDDPEVKIVMMDAGGRVLPGKSPFIRQSDRLYNAGLRDLEAGVYFLSIIANGLRYSYTVIKVD